VTKAELDSLEKALDKMFASANIDVEFTKHWKERVNDPRNKKQITVEELRSLFTKTYAKYKSVLSNAKVDWEAVLKDLNTNINVPFIIQYDAKNKEMDLIAKTVMRKPGFKSPDKILPV
jgi:predicted acetyltransferase